MNEIRDLLIGIDLGREFTQVSYYDRKANAPRSLSLKVGVSEYAAPTLMAKRPSDGAYLSGFSVREALDEEALIPIEEAYTLFGQDRSVSVGDENVKTSHLLACYLQEMLKFLGVPDVVRSTRCLSITCPSLSVARIRNIRLACEEIGFSAESCLILDYKESFYYYVMTQKKETWNRSVGWYDFDGDKVSFCKMSMNTSVRPVLVSISHPVTVRLQGEGNERDEDFVRFIQRSLGQEAFSSIQISGEGFDTEWAKKSVSELTFQRRRVFYGTNLYAFGACAAGREQKEARTMKSFCFLSDTMVRSEVGMEMRVMGSPTYQMLLESGKNWYECTGKCELILDNENKLVFVIQTLGESEKKKVQMVLDDLPQRPNKTTRLSVSLSYISPEECLITVKDMGFGDMYPPSGKVWKETVKW